MAICIENPDFRRVQGMIEDLTCQTDVEGGDIRSVASSMLVMAAEFYREVHGRDGPDGLIATLAKLAAMDASRAVQDFEERQFGTGGRA